MATPTQYWLAPFILEIAVIFQTMKLCRPHWGMQHHVWKRPLHVSSTPSRHKRSSVKNLESKYKALRLVDRVTGWPQIRSVHYSFQVLYFWFVATKQMIKGNRQQRRGERSVVEPKLDVAWIGDVTSRAKEVSGHSIITNSQLVQESFNERIRNRPLPVSPEQSEWREAGPS